ncbi:MAG: DUF3570 domain-containing protein [Gammaproteobacteria bacterium]|nr:DUF3570 domain-containing protein [Gammaproteobacteria bacterium]
MAVIKTAAGRVCLSRWSMVVTGTFMGLNSLCALATVLPEERADAMYHYYDGGGVRVTGPALLVRKNMADKISVSGSYYTDTISCASVDVISTASPFKEKRTEVGAGVDYLYNDSLMSLSITKSDEPDYIADTVSMNVSQDVFGGTTTLNMGYSRGKDTVLENTNASFSDYVNRYQYRLGVSQILTPTLRLSLNYEAITDEGYLNSPYRSARYFGAGIAERYPRSRESQALALRTFFYMQPHSSLRFEYRYFWDTWDIAADTWEAAYNTYISKPWLMELRYRYYTQNNASFYSDNFTQLQNYMARDKELSTFKSHTLGGKLTYVFQSRPSFLTKSTINVAYDHIAFKYADFSDVRTGAPYSFSANVVQLFLSIWY